MKYYLNCSSAIKAGACCGIGLVVVVLFNDLLSLLLIKWAIGSNDIFVKDLVMYHTGYVSILILFVQAVLILAAGALTIRFTGGLPDKTAKVIKTGAVVGFTTGIFMTIINLAKVVYMPLVIRAVFQSVNIHMPDQTGIMPLNLLMGTLFNVSVWLILGVLLGIGGAVLCHFFMNRKMAARSPLKKTD